MNSRDMNQIYQTVTVRLKEGKQGPPESFTREEKDYYIKVEKAILENRKNGFQGTYSFPYDYD